MSLSGNVVQKSERQLTLTSYATLNTSNSHGGMALSATSLSNGGTLNHKGNIDFDQAGSTGVLVSGSTLNNDRRHQG